MISGGRRLYAGEEHIFAGIFLLSPGDLLTLPEDLTSKSTPLPT
jgi:hypothetical protein